MGSRTRASGSSASRQTQGVGGTRGDVSGSSSHDRTSNSTHGGSKYRKYQIEKSTALGLLLPQNLRLEVRELDEDGHDIGLLYETTALKWWECMATLPPKFLLLSAGQSESATQSEKPATEINAAVAKVMRPLGNLPPGNRARIEMGYVSDCFKYSNSLPHDTYREWQVRQQGFKRVYRLQPLNASAEESGQAFVWRGSHSVLQSLNDSKASPICHGNLKLLGPNNELLAAWKQRRDSKILGSLYIFEAAWDRLPAEVIVTSCLYVVMVERILWTTFVGG
ncbi:uncharacterized protein AB675_6105 [Cyphellophora attinorum]|uniref:Uncharacterized protein n=1 Tax=Cyphellophora attinorum TaxID=1664694 RepID=A0A0N1H9D8_9EURO|nr:uncharacterized protein AB675_6105 [Phialophora attinorum]KPI44055.1 hypothetical protein AB675_6105 [Phialophora attinorum]